MLCSSGRTCEIVCFSVYESFGSFQLILGIETYNWAQIYVLFLSSILDVKERTILKRALSNSCSALLAFQGCFAAGRGVNSHHKFSGSCSHTSSFLELENAEQRDVMISNYHFQEHMFLSLSACVVSTLHYHLLKDDLRNICVWCASEFGRR